LVFLSQEEKTMSNIKRKIERNIEKAEAPKGVRYVTLPTGDTRNFFQLYVEHVIDNHPTAFKSWANARIGKRLLDSLGETLVAKELVWIIERAEEWRMLRDAAEDNKAGLPQGLVTIDKQTGVTRPVPPPPMRAYIPIVDALLDASEKEPELEAGEVKANGAAEQPSN
jgi:hypothetical protein